MRGPIWRVDDEDDEPMGAPPPLLVTGRVVRDALLRTWRIWVGAVIVGALLGVGALVLVPRQPTATATLLMVSPNPEGESAMTTDISLLMTRTVAEQVIADLDLEESPEALLSTVTATPMSDQILTVTAGGPNRAAAVARLSSFVNHSMAFRAVQLRSVSDGLVQGYEKRLAAVQAQVEDLTQEYSRISAASRLNQGRLNEVVTARSALTTQTIELRQAIEDATIRTDAAVSSTHVIDEPATSPRGSRRQVVLVLLSAGLLGGAIATGIILFGALTTDRLRRRQDVASALGVPVRVGVGPIRAQTRAYRAEGAVTTWVTGRLRGRPRRWTGQRRQRNLEALVQGLESALPRFTEPPPPRGATSANGRTTSLRSDPTTLGVAAVDRAHTTAVVLHTLAERLADRGVRVLVVDLSARGVLPTSARDDQSRAEADGWASPVVFRPHSDPALASGPRGTRRRPARRSDTLGDLGSLWGEAEVVLALVEVDPGIDLGLLGTWVSQLVPLVSAGRASHELLMTIAALIEGADLAIPFALLEGADPSDRTIGRPEPRGVQPVWPGRVQAR